MLWGTLLKNIQNRYIWNRRNLVGAYSYNLFGNQSRFTTSDRVHTNYTYRPDGLRHSIDDKVHVWDGANIVADIDGNNVSVYIRGINLIYANDGSRTYYHFNAHGDVVVLTNASGTKTKSYSYNAFGVEYNEATLDDNSFRYCGEYYDKETQTIYLRARYYNPALGRFTQQDGWEYANPNDPLSLNLYTYCRNNPIIFIDSNGHMWQVVPALDPRTRLYCGGNGNSDGRSYAAAAYESSAYNTYRIKSTTALYDAQLGGYHANNLSSGITNPSAYIVPDAQTVTDDMAVPPKKSFDSVGNLLKHFEKHNPQFENMYSSATEYLEDANYVINNGQYVPELNGYILFLGNKGGANYAFVGLKNAGNNISTFHIKHVKTLTKIPSLHFIYE